MEWVIYAAVTIAHAWAIINIIVIIKLSNSKAFKYYGATITTSPAFLAPFAAAVFFWFWFFMG